MISFLFIYRSHSGEKVPASRVSSLPHVSVVQDPQPPTEYQLHTPVHSQPHHHKPPTQQYQPEQQPWQQSLPTLVPTSPSSPRSESPCPNVNEVPVSSASSLLNTLCPSLSSLSSFAESLVISSQQGTTILDSQASQKHHRKSQNTGIYPPPQGDTLVASSSFAEASLSAACSSSTPSQEQNGPPRPPLPARTTSLESGAHTRCVVVIVYIRQFSLTL